MWNVGGIGLQIMCCCVRESHYAAYIHHAILGRPQNHFWSMASVDFQEKEQKVTTSSRNKYATMQVFCVHILRSTTKWLSISSLWNKILYVESNFCLWLLSRSQGPSGSTIYQSQSSFSGLAQRRFFRSWGQSDNSGQPHYGSAVHRRFRKPMRGQQSNRSGLHQSRG